MNFNEETYQLINDYFDGKLKGVHLDKFKNDLKNDKDFAFQVQIQKEIIDGIKLHRKNELKQILSDSSKTVYIKNEWGRKWTYASVAVVLFFMSLLVVIKYYIPNNFNTASEITNAPSEKELTNDVLVDNDEELYKNNKSNTQKENELLLASENTPSKIDEVDTLMSDAMDIASTPNMYSNIPEDDENEILKDRLISTVTYPIAIFTEESFGNQGSGAQLNEKPEKFPTRQNKDLIDADEKQKEEAKILTKSIQVQFWESPLNFIGYTYQKHNGLSLYGINKSENITFKELDNRLYLILNAKVYSLAPTKENEHKKLSPVAQPELLKILNAQ
jgi:hypothetical protein